MDTLLQDLRYALRTLRRSPAFTATAVLTLALGIGANTAIFSVTNALMFRKLAVREPDQLVSFQATARFPGAGVFLFPAFPYPAYLAFSRIDGLFSGVSAIYNLDRSNLALDGSPNAIDPSPVRVALVSGNYFSTLGVDAAAGRTLTPDDDRVPGGHPLAVTSTRYAERLFLHAPAALGHTLSLHGVVYTIVGVLPPQFQGDEVGQPADLWIPIAMQSQVMPERPGLLANPNPPWVRIVARLKSGVRVEQVGAAVQTVYRRTVEDRINLTPQMLASERQSIVSAFPANRGISDQRQALKTPLLVLATVVGLVLLLACANVANLLLARGAVRQREMGVRLAVGAGTARLVRQLLTESLVLAVGSGVAGLLLASFGTAALARTVASGLVPLDLELRPDLGVAAFTLVLSLLTGLLFGLAPAWRVSSANLSAGLRATPDRQTGRFRLQRALLVLQICVSVVLLIGAGLFIRTLRNLEAQDIGFDRDRLLLVSVVPDQMGLKGPEVVPLLRQLENRLAALPGVVAASSASGALLAGGGTASPVGVLGRQRGDDDVEQWNLVGPGFFTTIGMRLAGGREFTAHDDEAFPRVAVVNEAMALKYFGTRDAVGKRFGMRRDVGNEIEVVGVTRNAKYNTLRDVNFPIVYLPYLQEAPRLGSGRPMNLVLRTSGPSPALAAGIRDAVRAVAPTLPVLDISSVGQAAERTLVHERLVAWISGLFGGLAILLAGIGLYGVVAYIAARRTGEIGIRLAMGATRTGVVWMVLRDCLVLAGAGVAVGVPMALGLSRFISSLLFGVSSADTVTLLGTSGLLLAVAALAASVPAWRASRLDPMVALRSE